MKPNDHNEDFVTVLLEGMPSVYDGIMQGMPYCVNLNMTTQPSACHLDMWEMAENCYVACHTNHIHIYIMYRKESQQKNA